MTAYFATWAHSIRTVWRGLGLTHRHLTQGRKRRRTPQGLDQPGYFAQPPGAVTIQYPREAIPVPDVGRYRLYVEIDDCIGCDQCARVCPVDCIDIQKVRAPEDLALTSDGTKVKFWLPTFDIDMAKCCYCGLCTVVCPTECIVMTKSYDYADADRQNLNFHFGNLTPEEAVIKQAEWDAHEAEQKRLKAEALAKAKAAKATDSPSSNTAPNA